MSKVKGDVKGDVNSIAGASVTMESTKKEVILKECTDIRFPVLTEIKKGKLGMRYMFPICKLFSDFCMRKVDKREEKSVDYLEFEASIAANGVLQAIQVFSDLEIAQIKNGYHRWFACDRLGIQYIPIEIVEKPVNEKESVNFQYNVNLSKRGKLTDYRLYIEKAIKEGKKPLQIAKEIDKSEKSVYEILSLKSDDPDIQELFNKGCTLKNLLSYNKHLPFLHTIPAEIKEEHKKRAMTSEQLEFAKSLNDAESLAVALQLQVAGSQAKKEPIFQVNKERLDRFIELAKVKENKYHNVFLFITGQADSL